MIGSKGINNDEEILATSGDKHVENAHHDIDMCRNKKGRRKKRRNGAVSTTMKKFGRRQVTYMLKL